MAPDAPQMVEKGTAEAAWLMDGRYLGWTHAGDFGGVPFEDRAIDAYNNAAGRHESVWIDNFGTLILFFTGSCSEDGRIRELITTFDDPVSGGTVVYRTVTTRVDDDHFTSTASMNRGESEFKNMEIRSTRR